MFFCHLMGTPYPWPDYDSMVRKPVWEADRRLGLRNHGGNIVRAGVHRFRAFSRGGERQRGRGQRSGRGARR